MLKSVQVRLLSETWRFESSYPHSGSLKWVSLTTRKYASFSELEIRNSPCGEIGKHAGFRCQCRKASRFESGRGHWPVNVAKLAKRKIKERI